MRKLSNGLFCLTREFWAESCCYVPEDTTTYEHSIELLVENGVW